MSGVKLSQACAGKLLIDPLKNSTMRSLLLAFALGAAPYATHASCELFESELASKAWIIPGSKNRNTATFTPTGPLEGKFTIHDRKDNFSYHHVYSMAWRRLGAGASKDQALHEKCQITISWGPDCQGDVDTFFLEKLGTSITLKNQFCDGSHCWTGPRITPTCREEARRSPDFSLTPR